MAYFLVFFNASFLSVAQLLLYFTSFIVNYNIVVEKYETKVGDAEIGSIRMCGIQMSDKYTILFLYICFKFSLKNIEF